MTATFTIVIDGDQYQVSTNKLTATELLALASLSVTEYYLVEIKGKKQFPYKDTPEAEINLHEGSNFVSVFVGPTTVADGPLTGAILFAAELREMGYEVTELPDHHIKFPYIVEVGTHEGTELMMGFVVPPDFPLTPPHGPHINTRIHSNRSGGTHPAGGIHDSHPSHSKHFGEGWQHWSRPHPNWPASNRSIKEYMAFIRSLWATQ